MSKELERFRKRQALLKKIDKTKHLMVVPDAAEVNSILNQKIDNELVSSIELSMHDNYTVDYDESITAAVKYQSVTSYCSWCHEKSLHELMDGNVVARHDYKCFSCGNYTVICRYCENMATHQPKESTSKGMLDTVKNSWAGELCAEHDGSIASFKNLSLKLDNIEDYKKIFHRDKYNLLKAGAIGGITVATIATAGTFAYYAAPAIAASLGTTGALGAAGTGTIISRLSGAALINASLAAIGPGGMAGGVGVLCAAGSALGAKSGAVLANGYFGEIEGFEIKKVKDGIGPSILFINGFLSQKDQDATDWLDAVKTQYPDNPCYLVTWEASTLLKLGRLISGGLSGSALKQVIIESAKKGSKKGASKLNPLLWLELVTGILGNPWHKAMHKASLTGCLLADILARVKTEDGFILMGHSLGARVIYYTLAALATSNNSPVKDVFLLGGAVGNQKDDWNTASNAVSGSIYNIYSNKDDVLRYMYQGANMLISDPIGLNEMPFNHPSIKNFDASTIKVDGHMKHKKKLDQALNIIF
jgi:hypothetical protein